MTRDTGLRSTVDRSPEDRRRVFESTALPFLPNVHHLALRLTRDPEKARDLVQEAFLRAYRTFDNFRPGTNCRAWLFTILYSIFVNRYRREKREPRMVSLEDLAARFDRTIGAGLEPAAPAPPDAGLAWSDDDVRRAVDELPESFRSAVLLVDVEDLSYEEAAAVLGCPVGTVRSRLSRARRLLFVSLEDHARRLGYGRSPGEA